VDVEDLQTGNAEAGRRYFNGAGGCAKCHSITGEFAKVGSRYEGLALLQRLLYPGSGRGAGPAPAKPIATVTTSAGQVIKGSVAYHDEFTISLTDANGWTRSWPVKQVRITIDNPLHAHVEQLGKYTDEDMHNVFAYLQTLK
jgi:cytochrome c oxidase cbb3-type subunit 3